MNTARALDLDEATATREAPTALHLEGAPANDDGVRHAEAALTRALALARIPQNDASRERMLWEILEGDGASDATRARVREALGVTEDFEIAWRSFVESRRHRTELRATVRQVGARCLVDTDIPVVLDGARDLRVGDRVLVKIRALDRRSRTVHVVRVDAPSSAAPRAPDATVVAGRVEVGVVDGVTERGVAVVFRGFVGVAQRDDLPRGSDPRAYRKGQRVRFAVLRTSGAQIDLRILNALGGARKSGRR